jgi:uncharacterized membrane-anchored protein YitT (DUF2179 family)
MKKYREYARCVAGAFIVAVGTYFFKFPNNFSVGGVTGVAVILSNYFHLASAGTIVFVINIALLGAGLFVCGKDTFVKTTIGTLTLSASLILLEKVWPLTAPLTNQPLLELFFAVLLPAFGSAVLFDVNGSTGGTDIIAIILRKYTKVNIGTALLLSDAVITLGAFVFGAEVGLFSVLGLLLKTALIDYVIEGLHMSKCFAIITDKPDDICEFIKLKLNRGATVLDAVGSYSHGRRYYIVTVMNRYQGIQLRNYIKKYHPETFIIITNSSQIIGKGFRGLD